MKHSVKGGDWESDCKQPKTKCDTRIIPAAEIVPKGIEHKASRASFGQYNQSYDRHDKEYNVTDPTNHFECIQHPTKPKVPHNWEYNKSPHDESTMPSLWNIVGIVEDDKAGDDVG